MIIINLLINFSLIVYNIIHSYLCNKKIIYDIQSKLINKLLNLSNNLQNLSYNL